MIAVFANSRAARQGAALALAARPHPPAQLLAIQLGPDLEESRAGSTGPTSLIFEHVRGIRDQGLIVGVLRQRRLELVHGDQSVLMFPERVLDASGQTDEFARRPGCPLAQ